MSERHTSQYRPPISSHDACHGYYNNCYEIAILRVFYATHLRRAPHRTFGPGMAHVINPLGEADGSPATYGTMRAVDPTYPLYPIACFISVTMLFLVLLTNFERQSWNFGVASLCFWLLLENLSSAINAIVWADNSDVKLYVYCDIGECDCVCIKSILT